MFEGQIMSFDGKHYKVYYSADDDEEELSEYEFGDVEIIDSPKKQKSEQDVFPRSSMRTSTKRKAVTRLSTRQTKPATRSTRAGARDASTVPCGKKRHCPRPESRVGMRFLKSFEGEGTFEGRIVSFDGEHYKVHYSADNDEEELSENELEELEIIGRGSW
jgi:hypothetical protein